jgi:hypothetical protein
VTLVKIKKYRNEHELYVMIIFCLLSIFLGGGGHRRGGGGERAGTRETMHRTDIICTVILVINFSEIHRTKEGNN